MQNLLGTVKTLPQNFCFS